jgi:hypothetical protein
MEDLAREGDILCDLRARHMVLLLVCRNKLSVLTLGEAF